MNPSYGTLNDFKAFLDAAHQRGYAGDDRAGRESHQRSASRGSRRRAWLPPDRRSAICMCGPTTISKYKDARIIFTDTEKSNWTWDETAKAYYWHRFFSHQPDLNYDNPLVMEEVLKAMRFWLDMGVDGLRMDAIPYLCERDGTSCENLPETHAVVRRCAPPLMRTMPTGLILAEANQWPADVRPYFRRWR